MPETPPSRFRDALEPVDRVHGVFYTFVVAVCLVRFPALPEPWKPIAWYGGAFAATALLATLLRRRTGVKAQLPRVVFALLVAPMSFLMLSFVVPYANPWHGERWLKAIDDALFFGHNPNEMIDRITWPPLTEVLHFVYAFYYLIPLVLLVGLLRANRGAGLARGLFDVILCLYASYVGYFLIPATGPNLNVCALFPAHFPEPMEGLKFAERLRASMLEAEWIKHDCWPSGHTALSLTCLIAARREGAKTTFRILLVPVILLIFSTVYLRYHYVIDVLCGVALAWAVARFGPLLFAAWARRGTGPVADGPVADRALPESRPL